MKLKIGLIIFFLSLSVLTHATEHKYLISDIPKSLLSGAKAVIRKHETVFEISDISTAVQKEVLAVSILNKNGIPLSVLKQIYDKFSSVGKIKTTVYDKNGNIVHIDVNSSLMDVAAYTGYSLYDDYRVKVFDPKYASIPFTVEFSYEISYYGLLTYPSWFLYNDFNVSTEQAFLTVLTPNKFKIRYLERNMTSPASIYDKGGKTVYEWKVSSLPALREEPYSPSLEEYSPAVFLAPHDFEIGDYKGNCDSWTNFGLWIKKISATRSALDKKTHQKLITMVAGETSDLEKIRVLYNYMQNKVRYVSINIGMGGWRPIDAQSVEDLSYGDCKALSNYMKTLLDVIGIKSFYTLVKAGEDAPSLIDEFPSNQFNHAIVCVPLKSDTVWLECTDQQIPFGFLGTFTDDRKVLLISDSGGIVVKTRKYPLNDNTQGRKATIKIDEDGNAESSVSTDYRGIKYDLISRVLRMDDFDKKKSIRDRINLAQFDLTNYGYNETKTRVPSVIEELRLNVPEYASVTGGKLIFKPNFISRITNVPLRDEKREAPIYIRRSYSETDTITFLLRRQYKSDLKPVSFSLNTIFGDYNYSINFNNKKVYYIRSFKLFKGNYQPDKYDSFVDFISTILTEDNKQVVLDLI